MNCAPVFNPIADAYDGWYDTPEGRAIFHEEAACLRLLGNFSGAWLEVGGRAYMRKGAEGHPIYAHAGFLTATETVRLVEKAGFRFRRGCSVLFWRPGHPPAGRPRVKSGIVPEAGFVGLLFDVHPAGEPAVPINGG